MRAAAKVLGRLLLRHRLWKSFKHIVVMATLDGLRSDREFFNPTGRLSAETGVARAATEHTLNCIGETHTGSQTQSNLDPLRGDALS